MEHHYPKQFRIEDNMRLIQLIARRVHARFMKARISAFELEDLEQEFVVVWMQARKTFNAEMNVKFSTFFVDAAYKRANRIAEKHADRDPIYSASEIEGLVGRLPDEHADRPLDEVMECSIERYAAEKLSPMTARVLDLVRNPPELIVRAFRGRQAFAEHAREQGYDYRAPRRLTIGFVCQVMGLTHNHAANVRQELAYFAKELEQ